MTPAHAARLPSSLPRAARALFRCSHPPPAPRLRPSAADWFFHNPISHLRECDGDRCEFWRFRYPHRRDAAMQVVVDQALARFPPRSGGPLIISSFGSGLLFQEFCHVQKLIQAGYRNLRLVLVDVRRAGRPLTLAPPPPLHPLTSPLPHREPSRRLSHPGAAPAPPARADARGPMACRHRLLTRRGSRSTWRATAAAAYIASRRPSCTPTCFAPRPPTPRPARPRRPWTTPPIRPPHPALFSARRGPSPRLAPEPTPAPPRGAGR